jgi:hypothetical protein
MRSEAASGSVQRRAASRFRDRQHAAVVTAKKENPAVGTPGQTFVVIGVLRFLNMRPGCDSYRLRSVESIFYFSAVYLLVLLFSCSSMTFQI